MNKQHIRVSVFILVVLVQLYVPAKMIWDSENVIRKGTSYTFKTAPIDPNDPFRGKYITLRYDQNTVKVEHKKDWTYGEPIYVRFTTDDEGFAKIQAVSKEKPTSHQDYVKATVQHISNSSTLTVAYPFNRFYMEESKAYRAEKAYAEAQRDTSKVTYAIINIKNGRAVVNDVLIDGISVREIMLQDPE